MTLTSDITPAWVARSEDRLTPDALNALPANEIPFIRVSDFVNAAECDALVDGAVRLGFGPYRGVEPRIDQIGNTVFEFDKLSRSAYSERNPALRAVQRQIFARSLGPVLRLNKLPSLPIWKPAPAV
jgi:hypothetical protein